MTKVISFDNLESRSDLATTGPKTILWPESIQGCQQAARRPMTSCSSAVMSSANVGRGAFSLKTTVSHCLRSKDRGAHRERRPIGQGLRSDPAIDQASTEASQATHPALRSQALAPLASAP